MNRELQFDAGNTRLKWRFIINEEVVRTGFIDNSSNWQSELLALFDSVGSINRIWVSSVSGGERLQRLLSIAKSFSAAEVNVAKTQITFAGVTVAYELGVDRWLAMLAAHGRFPDRLKVIIDCGTALTVDVVDPDGQHQGGYIVPGLRLMKESLAVNTADLGKVEHPAEILDLGRKTEDCINHGVLAMAVSLVEKVDKAHPGALLILTGGDGKLLMSHLDSASDAVFRTDLVMDGLTVISLHQA